MSESADGTAAEPAREPWPPGAATGVGSLPGTDIREAVRFVLGELPDLAHLPELPARGVGADMIGRAATFLLDLAVDLQPSGWRLVPRGGVDMGRARDYLARDIDTLEELAEGYERTLKLQVAGPWTLASSVELHRGDKVIADPGATRDLAQSLTEGIALHVADVARRVPTAQVLLQLDEPSLPLVLAGRVPTASGFGTLRAVDEQVVEETLRDLVARLDVPVVVHCCAARVPVALLHRAGATALSLDARRLDPRFDDPLGEAIEEGLRLILGVLPGDGQSAAQAGDGKTVAKRAAQSGRRLGITAEAMAATVALSPTCGLAGATPDYVRAALRTLREAARGLAEDDVPG